MVGKDQAIGGVIFAVCVIVAIFYVITLFAPQWLSVFNVVPNSGTPEYDTWLANARFWVVAIPVFIAFVAIMGIGAWIGWTMATTPPPKPIEEITTEMEEKKEEKPAEKPVEETRAEPAPPPPPTETTEEKKPERKRRSEKL